MCIRDRLIGISSYKNGKADGQWEEYNTKGNLYAKGLYKNNQKHGRWSYFHNNGNIEEVAYHNMKGEWLRFHTNGNPSMKGKSGKKTTYCGVYKCWDEEGAPVPCGDLNGFCKMTEDGAHCKKKCQ